MLTHILQFLVFLLVLEHFIELVILIQIILLLPFFFYPLIFYFVVVILTYILLTLTFPSYQTTFLKLIYLRFSKTHNRLPRKGEGRLEEVDLLSSRE